MNPPLNHKPFWTTSEWLSRVCSQGRKKGAAASVHLVLYQKPTTKWAELLQKLTTSCRDQSNFANRGFGEFY
jgi:hypothetical protein